MLVVEDDSTVAEVLEAYLARSGIAVERAGDGPTALAAAERFRPDLVLLDLMLPGLDGLEVFRRLRAREPELAVIMVTARGDEQDRVLGLALGADDYVTKPFSPREVVLRVESVLRRSGGAAPAHGGRLVDGDLVIDLDRHEALRSGQPLALTGREFDLLAFLVAHPGVAYSREQLMSEVWHWDFGDSSTVTVHVRRLRTKVESDPSDPTRLTTVWGVGYRWEPGA